MRFEREELVDGRTFVAITTQFVDNGDRCNPPIDIDQMAANTNRLIDEGIGGIVVAGTTGESATIKCTPVIGLVNEIVRGRVPVFASTGSNGTAEAIRLTREVLDAGIEVDGFMSVVPYYNKPPQSGIVKHMELAAAAAQGKPLMLYNVPGRTVVAMTADTVSAASIPRNVVAIKQADTDLVTLRAIREQCPDLVVLSGDDENMFEMAQAGARGLVSVVANIAPRLTVDYVNACLSREYETLLRIPNNAAFLKLSQATMLTCNPADVKWAENLLGHGNGIVLNPLDSPNVSASLTIANVLREFTHFDLSDEVVKEMIRLRDVKTAACHAAALAKLHAHG